uniref:Ubiquitin-like protease family profile domain-containing protein n=1 Tax=Solanum lycopersicum TaxID=4081 RepID=A0A3Q7FJU1_SOLLC
MTIKKINTERSIALHPLLAVDEHTPLAIPRERRPGPFNTSPYVMTFSSEFGSSSRFHYMFELKHQFVAMSDVELTTLYMISKEEQYKKNKSRLQMWFHFGIHIDVILYYIRKRAKYSDSDNNEFNFITVNYNFNKLIANVWDAYHNLDSTVNKESTEESISEYINGYRIHVVAPWHTVDNILILVSIQQIFHWVLIVVYFNEKCIHVYDSLRGGSLHNSSVSNEIKKYAQLIPMYLSLVFTGRKALTYRHIRNTSSILKLTLLKLYMSMI